MEAFGRGGQVLSARVLNRTATFVFYIGNRYHGVLTAFVPGQDAADYRFTSALPVSILKLLSPAINERLANPDPSVIIVEREALRKSKEPEKATVLSPS